MVDALLARGGMADVYRARDVVLDRPVALKAFRVGTTDVRRFERETRLLANLDHANLVRLLDAGQHDGEPYLVLELIEGQTLADRLERGALDPTQARRVGGDIARALAYVHAQGVIHRDVKPSNILLATDGRALLADFGVARLVDGTRLTETRATIGTAADVAPEQIGGAAVTVAADVYALGLVLIEALLGWRAFTGTQQEILAARVARDPQIPPGLPPPWNSLLRAMTSRDPAARPPAATVAGHLAVPPWTPTADVAETEVLPEADTTKTLPSGTGPEPGTPRQRPVLWLVATLVAVAVLAGIVLTSGAGDTPSDPGPDATGSTTTTASTSTTLGSTVPTTGEPASPPGAGCADFDARKQAIDAEKQRVDEIHRDDPETRERLKGQLENNKRALDAQKQELGC